MVIASVAIFELVNTFSNAVDRTVNTATVCGRVGLLQFVATLTIADISREIIPD